MQTKKGGGFKGLLLRPKALKFSAVKMKRSQQRRMEKSGNEVGRNQKYGALETKGSVSRRKECQMLQSQVRWVHNVSHA